MILTAAALAFLSTCAPNVDHATMAGIVEHESGWHTYAIADYSTHPATSYYPTDLGSAVLTVRLLHERGHHVAAGLAQINEINWSSTGLNEQTVFLPCANVRASDAILSSDYSRALKFAQSGDAALKLALSWYAGDKTTSYADTVFTLARSVQADTGTQIVVQNGRVDAVPASAPVAGEISSGFGWRSKPFAEFHAGLDIAAEYGSPVYATAPGIVVRAASSGGFGNKIEIDHQNGYQTWFGHLSEIVVRPNQSVQRGELIGRVGSTGLSTGPHLHYQVMHNGSPTDPRDFLGGAATARFALGLPVRSHVAETSDVTRSPPAIARASAAIAAALPIRHVQHIPTSAVVGWAVPQQPQAQDASHTQLPVRKRSR